MILHDGTEFNIERNADGSARVAIHTDGEFEPCEFEITTDGANKIREAIDAVFPCGPDRETLSKVLTHAIWCTERSREIFTAAAKSPTALKAAQALIKIAESMEREARAALEAHDAKITTPTG